MAKLVKPDGSPIDVPADGAFEVPPPGSWVEMHRDRSAVIKSVATVPLVATLFDPSTGKRADVREDVDADWAETYGPEYRWTEGNDACDCNRRNYLLRALGELGPTESIDPDPCGDTIILERLTVNGEVVIESPRPTARP